MTLSRGVTRSPQYILVVVLLGGLVGSVFGIDPAERRRETRFRLGRYGSIVSVRGAVAGARGGVLSSAGQTVYPHPRPRLAGFSPLIAITTSDARRPRFDDTYEHELQSTYVGNPLSGDAAENYVIGILDSGADINLAAGTFAETLGLSGAYLTANTIGIGGVGEPVLAYVTQPVGFFAAGLSAIDQSGRLDLGAVVGHTNVSGIVAPPIICGYEETVSAVLGTPFLSFHKMQVRVDSPVTAVVNGGTVTGPDVRLYDPSDPLTSYRRAIFLEFGNEGVPVTTASYWPNLFDLEDQETPFIPTRLSLAGGFIPPGGWFFATIHVLEGVASPTNVVQPMRVLVDTGAQSSIMSRGMAAALSLPPQSDFTVDVCGVGGLVTDVPGYYVDYVKINAMNGALEFSRAPFVVIDLPSPEGGGVLDGILGMNFFWNRNITFEPSLTGTGFLTVSEPVAFAAGDFNLDQFVDDGDVADFLFCFFGPGTGPIGPGCEHVDIDESGSVDLADFALLQTCFAGPDSTADPTCGG